MAKNKIYIEFPQGKIKIHSYGKNAGELYIEYNDSFINEFNNNLNKTQLFIDKTVSQNLMAYVSFRSGIQQKSIKLATVLGSAEVVIGVPYAELQAYSNKIRKRIGKRGTHPFERMRADKKDSILRQVSAYSARLKFEK